MPLAQYLAGLARPWCFVAQVFTALGFGQILPGDQASADVFSAACAREPNRCVDILNVICGANPENLNATRLPLYLQYTPAGGVHEGGLLTRTASASPA